MRINLFVLPTLMLALVSTFGVGQIKSKDDFENRDYLQTWEKARRRLLVMTSDKITGPQILNFLPHITKMLGKYGNLFLFQSDKPLDLEEIQKVKRVKGIVALQTD